jgi:tetratricopeptide (TPR) repeat protein
MPRSRCEPPVPPKIRIPQTGPLAFMYVLSDFDALGLENEGMRLWQALRRVRDWHASPPDGLSPRFGDARKAYEDVDPALRPSLAALDRLLRDPDPDAATIEAAAFACLNAALWAEERGAYRTALGFLHAAEDVDPDNPHYAYNLGRVARKMAFYEESEAWLKWAHYVARSYGRWEVATLALSGLGNLHRQRGNLPKARRFHEVTRRMARLKNLRTLEGDALYDLTGMAFDFGDAVTGMEYARLALAAYGPGHGRIITLAHDIAWFWMDGFGDFQNAAFVFNSLREYVWEPAHRILLTAHLARAAAGAGWKDTFELMWLECWSLMSHHSGQDGHAGALTQLALGAGTFDDWDRANLAATEATRLARERKEGEMLALGESILQALANGFIADEAIKTVFKDRARQVEASLYQAASEVASTLAHALRARRDGAPQSPTRALFEAES